MGTAKPYDTLLSKQRARTTSKAGRNIAEESASDYSRVLYSSPFRRLQAKAQVFSLESNAAVRSRMTHSLEVAEVGKRIARNIVLRITGLTKEHSFAFVQFVETACLMHDLGNPPFGHFGEVAIQEWFRKSGERCFKKAIRKSQQSLLDQALCDFLQFDGNPQTFRIVTKLQWVKDEFGLNLTFTQLLASLKYIRSTDDPPGEGPKKKPGYFATETDRALKAFEALDYPQPKRFPLAYIVEAADDIAYCLSDIEDGIEKCLIDPLQVFDEIRDTLCIRVGVECVCDIPRLGEIFDKIASQELSDESAFLQFKTGITEHLITTAAQRYLEKHCSILRGQCDNLFNGETPESELLRVIREFARKKLFRSEEAEKMELTGYNVIYGLLDAHKRLLECSREDFGRLASRDPVSIQGRGLDVEWRLFNRLPPKYVQAYKHEVAKGVPPETEWLHRAHLITDYISGMTDHFALRTYQCLKGICLT